MPLTFEERMKALAEAQFPKENARIQEAIKRAKEVAAKNASKQPPNLLTNRELQSTKQPHNRDETSDDEPMQKRVRSTSLATRLDTSSSRQIPSAYSDDRRAPRAVAPSAYSDDRRSGRLPPQPTFSDDRRQTRQMRPPAATMSAAPTQEGPEWYRKLSVENTRNPDFSSQDVILRSLKGFIRTCKATPNADHTAEFKQIRDNLHAIAFVLVTGQLLRNQMMLHNGSGLPQLFKEEYSGGVKWPFDIKADALEQYEKWYRGVFETDIMRGIVPGRAARYGRKKEVLSAATPTKIEKDYPYKVSAKYFGNGRLANGQWWPLWYAAMRDGAHGTPMGGIYGETAQGAYSCVLSAGKGYTDEDHGDWLWYCGTDGKDGNVSEQTQWMLLNEVSGQPVRLLRSHEAAEKSKWAPKQGLRYDGLYHVMTHEHDDGPENALRRRHRFRLVRVEGQDPIRYQGPEERPTREELNAERDMRRARGMAG